MTDRSPSARPPPSRRRRRRLPASSSGSTGEGRLRGARRDGRAIGAGGPRPTSRSAGVTPRLPRAVGPGALFVAVPGEHVDGHDHRRRGRGRRAPPPRSSSAPVPDVAAAAARGRVDAQRPSPTAAAWWYGDPSRELAVDRHHRAPTARRRPSYLAVAALEAAGLPTGLLGTVGTRIGGMPRAQRRARDDARGAELQARLRAMVDGRRRRGGRRDDLARARARAGAGDRLRRRDPHQPDPRAPRVPRHVRGLPGRQAVAVRAPRRSAEANPAKPLADERRRSSTPTTRRPASFIGAAQEAGAPRHHVRHGPDGRRPRRPGSRRTPVGSRIDVRRAAGAATLELALAGRFNVHNALAVVALGEALGLDPAAVRDGLGGGARSCPGGWSASTLGQPFNVVVDYAHSPASLADRARPARAARGGPRRRPHRRLRLGRRARRREAAADGPDRRRALPPRGGHRRGPARRGPRGDPRRDRRAAPRRPARSAATTCSSSPTGARRSRRPSSAPGPATSCCSPARATSARSSGRTARALGRAAEAEARPAPTGGTG